MSKVVSLLPPQVFSTTTLKYWPLKREVQVNHLLEHVQKLTKVTPMSLYSAVRYAPVPWDANRRARLSRNVVIHHAKNTLFLPQKLFQFCCSFHSSLFLLAWISLLVIRWLRSGKLKSTGKVIQTTDQSLILSGWFTVVVFQNFHIKRPPKFSEFSVIGGLASLILTRTPKLEFPWLLRKVKPRIIDTNTAANTVMCGDEDLFIVAIGP